MKILDFLVMFICVSLIVHTLQSKIIDIKVDGLVCDFCAQSIEKVFMKQPGVKVVYVNLERGNVQIKMADVFEENEDGISDIRIKKLFQNAGYTVSSIKRK
tara:strand:+ start:1623 stop:1925 length:303 start_codon:yes stop_codon:yes gene_type:complete